MRFISTIVIVLATTLFSFSNGEKLLLQKKQQQQQQVLSEKSNLRANTPMVFTTTRKLGAGAYGFVVLASDADGTSYALKVPNDIGRMPCTALGEAFSTWNNGPLSKKSKGICDNPQCNYNWLFSCFTTQPKVHEAVCADYLIDYDQECAVAQMLSRRSPNNFNNCVRSRIDARKAGDTVDGQKMAFIAMELLNGGDLGAFIDGMNPENDYKPMLKKMCNDMVDALSALISASPKMLHRDIKPENVWWDADANNLKLIDYGNSDRTRDESNFFGHGTLGYYAYVFGNFNKFTIIQMKSGLNRDRYAGCLTLADAFIGPSPANSYVQARSKWEKKFLMPVGGVTTEQLMNEFKTECEKQGTCKGLLGDPVDTSAGTGYDFLKACFTFEAPYETYAKLKAHAYLA